ncbi:YiiX/YebB-like N1pC/P60 family cysteine hydrolase [Calycomorphotria hydatis]|uniref:Permuted papain-like amidase enzyme, YaeF/YiiX, C92 family n=1 Tax=Calycomorphotria hydatis TaxID=2528027 RepID=A0A517T900_9PLAN|nr:YiiX/YebB-like N1pC/P60 family cysteine hydrolase [Calycomorphotria hydatis]QDT64855.1 hypothetical protein V22_20980 [Calycomorphotria hydatis]
MFTPGPLHSRRKEIIAELEQLPLRTGDILYRYSDARGPLGLPFSRLLRIATDSLYSHAALALVEHDELYVKEVTDRGTLKLRVLDWLSTCADENMQVQRLKSYTSEDERNFTDAINRFLEADYDYDYKFNSRNRYYCFEAVFDIYKECGYILAEPKPAKELITPVSRGVIATGNFFFKPFGTSLPLDKPLHYAGNDEHGMLSSPLTECVYKLPKPGEIPDSN